MSLTDTFRVSHQIDGSQALSGQWQETGNSRVLASVNVPANSTNVQVTAAWTNANVQAIEIMAAQAMTLKTNSTSSPGNTISLKAGIPLIWSVSMGYFSNPFTVDVTTLYVTSTTAGQITVRVLTT